MHKIPLSSQELNNIRPGEALTLGAVIAVMVIALMAVVVYKLFSKDQGKVKLPGSYSFEWK